MNHFTYKRFQGESLVGYVNIPYGTRLDSKLDGNLLFLGMKPITNRYSQNGIEHFCRDDDGLGPERGKLIRAIAFRNRPFTLEQHRTIREGWPHFVMDYDELIFDNAFYDADVDELRQLADALNIRV